MIQLEFLLLVLAAARLPAGRTRALAAAAAISASLALAGLRAGSEEAGARLSVGFLAVESALFAVAAVLGLFAAALGARIPRAPRGAVLGVVAAGAGGLGIGLSALPFLRAAAPLAAMMAAAATTLLGLMLVWAGARAGWTAEPSHDLPVHRTELAAIGAGALCAAVSPWAGPVLLGALIAAAGGWAGTGTREIRRVPIAPVLTLVLIPAWWLMRTIAGPEGLVTASLPELPWSPAAERLLAAVLLLAGWAMSGLWPLHRQEPAPLTAPVAALLMVRVAIPAFPDGLEHWRALVLPLVLLGLWHGVLTGNRSEALVGLAWVGLATALGPGQAGAGLILVGALSFLLAERVTTRPIQLLHAIAVLEVGQGTLLVIEAGLRTEVVYTVCAVAALLAAVVRWSRPQANTASALSTTAPSA